MYLDHWHVDEMADIGDCDLDDLVNPARRAVARWLGRRGGRALGDALLYRRGGWAAGPRRGVEPQDEVPCGYPVSDPGGDFAGCSRDRRGNVQPAKGYLALRSAFGGTLLLGLEILVAADLVRTVAVAPTLVLCRDPPGAISRASSRPHAPSRARAARASLPTLPASPQEVRASGQSRR